MRWFLGGVAQRSFLLGVNVLKCTLESLFETSRLDPHYLRRQCWDTGDVWNSDTDATLDLFMDACSRFGLKVLLCTSLHFHSAVSEEVYQVSFHIEPYPGRSEATVRADLVHIINRFGQHGALYRLSAEDSRPVFYIYDRYVPA